MLHDLNLFEDGVAIGGIFQEVGVNFFEGVGFVVESDFVDVGETAWAQELVLGKEQCVHLGRVVLNVFLLYKKRWVIIIESHIASNK